MKMKSILPYLFILFLLSSCGHNIAMHTDKNIRNVKLGTTKDEVIKTLGDKYLINTAAKDKDGKLIEVLAYRSSHSEEYKLKFVNGILIEWNREYTQKYIINESSSPQKSSN